jgi:hypothetical protein
VRANDGIREKISDNVGREVIADIQKQASLGNRNQAYKSLKKFLNEELSPIAKKLGKVSEEEEEKMLGKILDKLSSVQI